MFSLFNDHFCDFWLDFDHTVVIMDLTVKKLFWYFCLWTTANLEGSYFAGKTYLLPSPADFINIGKWRLTLSEFKDQKLVATNKFKEKLFFVSAKPFFISSVVVVSKPHPIIFTFCTIYCRTCLTQTISLKHSSPVFIGKPTWKKNISTTYPKCLERFKIKFWDKRYF